MLTSAGPIYSDQSDCALPQPGFPIRTSSVITLVRQLTGAFRSLPRPSSAPSAKASTVGPLVAWTVLNPKQFNARYAILKEPGSFLAETATRVICRTWPISRAEGDAVCEANCKGFSTSRDLAVCCTNCQADFIGSFTTKQCAQMVLSQNAGDKLNNVLLFHYLNNQLDQLRACDASVALEFRKRNSAIDACNALGPREWALCSLERR